MYCQRTRVEEEGAFLQLTICENESRGLTKRIRQRSPSICHCARCICRGGNKCWACCFVQLDPAIHVTQSIASSSEQQEHEESGPSTDCQLVGARLEGFFGLAVELVTIDCKCCSGSSCIFPVRGYRHYVPS